MEKMTMTIATRTRADVAWLARAVRPLLSDTGVRVQGTGVSAVGIGGPTAGSAVAAGECARLRPTFAATAPTQPTAMDVVYSEPGRPPI